MASVLSNVALQLESQSLNSIVGGFSFASALAWYTVVKTLVEKTVKSGNGLKHDLIAALVTTLLAIMVFMVVKAVARNVKINEPNQAMFAVTR
jgi:hypothetical protein